MFQLNNHQWALILGGSSGFGLATAKKLSASGMSVCVVHRDRRGAMKRIEEDFDQIRSNGNPFFNLNLDALSTEGIEKTLTVLQDKMGQDGSVKLLLHSIAFGNLKPIVPDPEKNTPYLEDEDMTRTIYSMGTSMLTWTQRLHSAKLFSKDALVVGLTSEGNQKVWSGYAAVSAAKVALESVSRAIAVEFAPAGIRSIVVQAGVTETPALKLIPGNEKMVSDAIKRNPYNRLTKTEDVANVISLLCSPEAKWINGTLIHVDGGEHLN